MQERTANNKHSRISPELQEYINELVKEVVLNGKDYESLKKWLKKYAEMEGIDFNTLNDNLLEFFEVLPEYHITSSNFIKKQVELLARTCYVTDETFEEVNSLSNRSINKNQNFKAFTETVNGVSFKMIAVEGGNFQMGSTVIDIAEPIYSIPSFYIAETVVTQELWKAVMGTNPSYFKGDQRPVESISWYDAKYFIKKINLITGKTYSLPSEFQWEYAAKGGKKSQCYKYSGSNDIGDVAWYDDYSLEETQLVRTKKANELGIHDMNGNVWEWCEDVENNNYKEVPVDVNDWSDKDDFRVLRGGSWDEYANNCTIEARTYFNSYENGGYEFGFRLVFLP